MYYGGSESYWNACEVVKKKNVDYNKTKIILKSVRSIFQIVEKWKIKKKN